MKYFQYINFALLLFVVLFNSCICFIFNNTVIRNSLNSLLNVSNTPVIQPKIVAQQVLWQSGEAKVDIYRCPLLTYTPAGNLLAIVEGRKNNGDEDLKFIVTKRSVDGGFEWETASFIYDDQMEGKEDNLGVVIVDDVTKEIFIFYVICAHPSACDGIDASVVYVKSSDDGVSWKARVNVTAQAGPKNFAPGPGYGLQKKFAPHKGRLIVCGHGGNLLENGNFCLLSDDHGKTWRWGAEILPIPAYTNNQKGDFVPDECQPIELPDGSIVLNARNQYHYHCNCRIVYLSYDGMETIDLSTLYMDASLVDPAVAASLLTHKGITFFSNPATETSRTNMMLKWSYDNGQTWPGRLTIWNYASGYSCLTAFPDKFALKKQKYIYLLFEKGKTSYTESISFVTISLDGTV